jgi:Gram-negative bacterial TonB protein C-terminal
MRLHIAPLLALFFALPLSGQSGSATPVPILQGAALPRYPPIAMAAHVTGKVILHVTVKDGLVVKTDVVSKLDPSGQRFLETATIENLKTWHFAVDVNGIFTVSYAYAITGAETDNPTNAKVTILPSLDVEVTGRPVKPTVNY